jgi:hypothetical protein
MASFMLVVLSKQKLGDEPFLIFFHVEAPQVTGSSKAVQPKFPLIMLTAFILAFVRLAHWQQPKKVLRIGYLTTRSGPEAGKKAFLQGLQSLGYIEGQTIAIESNGGSLKKSSTGCPNLLTSSSVLRSKTRRTSCGATNEV